LVLLAGCVAESAGSSTPNPPRATSGIGQFYGYFVSPVPGALLTVSFVRGDQVIDSATAPSGAFDLKLPSGPYQLRFATAHGPVTGCDAATIDVKPDTQTIVNQDPPPPGCNLWVKFDNQHPLERNRGVRADVKTEFGAYDGYEVLACTEPDRDALFYVVGTGTERPPENADRKHDQELNNWVEDKRHRITAVMKPMGGGAGFGRSCRSGTPATINVYVADYRQVDETIARLGAVIREQRLGNAFTITLMPISVNL
jgi:hypothetical protein